MKLKNGLTTLLLLAIGLTFSFSASAQCETWVNSPKKDAAETAHVLYRQNFKAQKYDEAFEQWQKAYSLAPNADGQRPFHYTDGRDIYLHKIKNTEDEAKKKEYAENVLRLYDEQIACYPKDEVFLLGRKAYDMYYNLRSPYSDLLTVLKGVTEKGGNDVEYIILDPYARVAVYEYQKERLSKEEARAINIKLNEIADHNVENNQQYGEQFKTAQEAMNGVFAQIEDEIFDCAYFKDKLVPKYKENPEDLEIIKYVYNKLRQQDCDSSEPIMMELKGKYETMAAAINDSLRQDFLAKNPGVHARELYDAGDFSAAISKYEEAISMEADTEKKADYYFGIASILFRKQNQYSKAREYARKAADMKSGWGQPYMLIGDMYASTSRSCGDAWGQRMAVLAAMDKYAYAKSIDSSVSEDANRKIGIYSSSKPERQEGFMRGVKPGQSVKVGCWIGETVKVSFQ